jgi:hypothetical protein
MSKGGRNCTQRREPAIANELLDELLDSIGPGLLTPKQSLIGIYPRKELLRQRNDRPA